MDVSTRGGDAVLLLHGQPGGAADWSQVITRLGPGVSPIAPDRPGWDGSRPATGLEGNARAALDALDAAGAQRALVAGHSLGAGIAAWLAVRHPERVSGLVLAAPAANLASLYPIDYWLGASITGDVLAAAGMLAAGVALWPAAVRRRLAAAVSIDATYLDEARRVLVTPSAWRAYALEQRALLEELPALDRRLPEIAAPTIILTGLRDRIVPSRAARALAAQIPGATVQEVPGAGHLLPQRHPDRVAAAITAALAERRGATLGGG